MSVVDYEEKRSFQRMDVQCIVEFMETTGSLRGCGLVENVSAHGIAFQSALQVGRKSNLLITVKGGRNDVPMSGAAVVLRCEPSVHGYRVACWVNELE